MGMRTDREMKCLLGCLWLHYKNVCDKVVLEGGHTELIHRDMLMILGRLLDCVLWVMCEVEDDEFPVMADVLESYPEDYVVAAGEKILGALDVFQEERQVMLNCARRMFEVLDMPSDEDPGGGDRRHRSELN